MQLISALAAGVKGAENGKAELFNRGTTVRATWFTDFIGQNPNSSGQDIDLSANGGAVVYVSQYVDVRVKDDQGATVVFFTQGDASPLEEVISPSFEGADYTTPFATGANKPTTLQAVLDKVIASFGATDWQVDINGTPTDLDAAIAGLAGVYFNVKSSAYGAVGDGVADDTAAIQAAITAAGVSGGIVFFPNGTYRLTSALNLVDAVSLQGSGPGASILTIDHASENTLNTVTTTVPHSFIADLSMRALQSNSGRCINLAGNVQLLVRNVTLGNSLNTGLALVADGAGSMQVVFQNCTFAPGSSTTACFRVPTHTGRIRLQNCVHIFPATYIPGFAAVYGTRIDIEGGVFDGTAITAGGGFSYFQDSSTTLDSSVRGVLFSSTGGGASTVTCLDLGTYLSGSVFVESGNTFAEDANLTAYSYTFAASARGANVLLYTREQRVTNIASDVTPLTIPVQQFGIIRVERTSNADQTLVNDGQPPEGATGIITVWNGNVANITNETINTSSGISNPITIQALTQNHFSYRAGIIGLATETLINEDTDWVT